MVHGHHHGFPWVDLPVFQDNGAVYEDGIVKGHSGNVLLVA